jgi:hypothetical protein
MHDQRVERRWHTTTAPIHVVLQCDPHVRRRVIYTIDTLFMAAGLPCDYVDRAPREGVSLVHAASGPSRDDSGSCLFIRHSSLSWQSLSGGHAPLGCEFADAADVLRTAELTGNTIDFDLFSYAFFFLASAEERRQAVRGGGFRATFGASTFAEHTIPQDIVDRYVDLLIRKLRGIAETAGVPLSAETGWPSGKAFAIVLSHDVDYLPERPLDNAIQGARSVLRHAVKQRDLVSAVQAFVGIARAAMSGRDPYGCIPEILAQERARGVRASYQVAVAHRHANDVNYRVDNPSTAEYLRVLCGPDADLCLHGSVRSTENAAWYVEEVETLARHLARPLGSRQHYLSFDYDALFSAQERAGIQYDMSLGYPDQIGSRCGFSFPFFPYNLQEDRPYDVLQISLFLMDVTLQSYLGLRADRARDVARGCIDGVRRRGGCVSIVWHPIVFGGARDPGYDSVYWDLVDHVLATNGLATDGRTINDWWRGRAAGYASFQRSSPADAVGQQGGEVA